MCNCTTCGIPNTPENVSGNLAGTALILDPSVLDALSTSPALSLSAKRALGDANRLCRETVRKYLFGKEPVVVHDSDCTVANAHFVLRVLLKANPDLTLAVRNDTFYPTLGLGEIEKKENERAEAHSAREFKYILWPPAVNQPQLKTCPTRAFWLGHILADKKRATVHLTNGTTFSPFNMASKEPRIETKVDSAVDAAVMAGPLFRNALLYTTTAKVLANREVHLSKLQLNDDAVCHAIAERVRDHAAIVKEVSLPGNAFGLAGARAIFSPRTMHKPEWPNLRRLNLTCTPVGARAYPAICGAIAAGHMPLLTTLYLGNTCLGDIGARLVFQTLNHMKALKALHLNGNPFGKEGVFPLKAAFGPHKVVAAKLQTLRMGQLPAMDEDAWKVVGRAVMNGCFPALYSFDGGAPGAWRGEAHPCDPVMLAVRYLCADRQAQDCKKRAEKALRADAPPMDPPYL